VKQKINFTCKLDKRQSSKGFTLVVHWRSVHLHTVHVNGSGKGRTVVSLTIRTWTFVLRSQTQSEHSPPWNSAVGVQGWQSSFTFIWFGKDKQWIFDSTKRILSRNWRHFSGLGVSSYGIYKWHRGRRCDSLEGALECVYRERNLSLIWESLTEHRDVMWVSRVKCTICKIIYSVHFESVFSFQDTNYSEYTYNIYSFVFTSL
jgi:hypothetical protein